MFKRKRNRIVGKELSDNFIFDTFIKLTSKTYPYGFEDEFVHEMTKIGLLPKNLEKDKHGNYFIKIGESRTVFASHFDTACKDSTGVTHVIDGKMIKTDGKTILGADDKAGVTIMLYMIKNKIPGLYYFFIGEEVGCVGSKQASVHGKFKGVYDRIISFDRKDVGSVITYQSSSRCCSDVFANQLASELNKSGLKYRTDDTGVYTDSAEFTSVIPECTNLSVGYYREHTTSESQDIEHLNCLAKACLKVNWEGLITKRDPSKTEYKSYKSTNIGTSYGASYGSSSSRSGWGSATGGWSKGFRSREYSDSDDFYDDVDDDDFRYKKTRRGDKKKESKHYFDNGGELLEVGSGFSVTNHISRYDWIMSKFLEEKLTFDELDVIHDQYLDMDTDSDRQFYVYLVGYINDRELINEQYQ